MVCVLLLSATVWGQDNSKGSVVIHGDSRLELLFKKKHTKSSPIAGNLADKAELKKRGVEATVTITGSKKADANGGTEKVPPGVNTRPVVLTTMARGRAIYSGKGYRVQIYNGADRVKAIKVKTDFMRHYPGVRTYLTYMSPSFRVKVGDYRNRSDAEGMLKEANSMYSPSMIVPDIITINTF